jgi:hypothetical protein
VDPKEYPESMYRGRPSIKGRDFYKPGIRFQSAWLIELHNHNVRLVEGVVQSHTTPGGSYTVSYVDYIVSAAEAVLAERLRLRVKRSFPVFGGIKGIEWEGDPVGERLKGDYSLHQRLLARAWEWRRFGGITVVPDPVGRCARIRGLPELPSRELFDCLEEIARHLKQPLRDGSEWETPFNRTKWGLA